METRILSRASRVPAAFAATTPVRCFAENFAEKRPERVIFETTDNGQRVMVAAFDFPPSDPPAYTSAGLAFADGLPEDYRRKVILSTLLESAEEAKRRGCVRCTGAASPHPQASEAAIRDIWDALSQVAAIRLEGSPEGGYEIEFEVGPAIRDLRTVLRGL